ncbi:hypothetical protein V5E38_23500 [Rossellomorea sp. GAMAL-10_SWC]
MNKVKKIAVVSALVAGLGISGTFYASSSTQADKSENQRAFSNLVKEHQSTKSLQQKSILMINKKTYSNKEFSAFKESKNLVQRNNGKQALSDAKIKEDFIKESVLEQEAEKQNINVTTAEAKAFADQMKQAVAQSQDPNTKQFLTDYISALGISEDEYWNNYATPAYQKALKIGKLKGNFFKQEKAKNANLSDVDLNSAWEKQQEKLVKESTVESLN